MNIEKESICKETFARKFGYTVFQVRTAKNISPDLLARKVGVKTKYIKQLEGGEKTASLDVIVCIANALGISLNELLAGSFSTPAPKLHTHPTAAKLAALSEDCRQRIEAHLELELHLNGKD